MGQNHIFLKMTYRQMVKKQSAYTGNDYRHYAVSGVDYGNYGLYRQPA